jgi:secondary thiamine-phosphate synthase enzyme
MDFVVTTQERCQLVDITGEVRRAVRASGVRDGLCLVWCPHTTAGITVNENADPDVPADLLMGLGRVVDSRWPFRHGEGNSDAHLKSSLVGCERTIAVRGGEPRLGTWQGVWFCEFDGPRTRRVEVTVLPARASG